MSYKDDGTDWNQLTKEYLDVFNDYFNPSKQECKDKIKELDSKFINIKDKSILDCGCNIGMWYPFFKELGYKYTGIDGCKEAIDFANNYYKESCFINKSLQDIDYNEEFMFINCMSVLQHVYYEDKVKILNNIYKSLHYTGLFLLMDSVNDITTETQLTREEWLKLCDSIGFIFVTSFCTNEKGIDDVMVFIKRRIVYDYGKV